MKGKALNAAFLAGMKPNEKFRCFLFIENFVRIFMLLVFK